ncbi:MAG: lipid A export permease/ATP-binding protein MsbA [Candidatus Eutrophobiaceae bacterium]
MQHYKRLFGYLRRYARLLIIAIILMIFSGLLDATIPIFMKYLFDGTFIIKDKKLVLLISSGFFLLFLLRGIVNYVSKIAASWVTCRVIMDLRQEMFERVLEFRCEYHDRNPSGPLVSRFSYDAERIGRASALMIAVFFRDFLLITGLLAWMIYINPLLTAIYLVAAPCLVFVIRYIKRRLRKTSLHLQKSMGNLHHSLQECVHGHQVIKLHAAGENHERERFIEEANAYRHYSMKFIVATSAASPLVEIILSFFVAISIYISSGMAVTGELSIGKFVSYFIAMLMLHAPVKRLANLQEQTQIVLAACESIFSILDAKERENLKEGKDIGLGCGQIRYEQVSFQYRGMAPATQEVGDSQEFTDSPADSMHLENIDLEIFAGETVALVGSSGSGKTTMVNLLPRFYEPIKGRILIDGVDIREINLRSLRRQIAYVSQHVVLFNDTVRNNIAYGAKGKVDEAKIIHAAEMAHALEFIESLPQGMETMIGESGLRLSGGQRQRLAIARALLKDAPILIMDEATSALDTRSERYVQMALDNIHHSRICIIVAHRLSTVESADRIVVMHKGRIVESGTHTELLAKGSHYQSLYQQNFVDGDNAAE